MVNDRYRYAIEFYRSDGTCVGQVPVTMDSVPALEWTWLQGLRHGQLELSDGTGSSAVRPLWNREVGEPYMDGFRVTILSDADDGVSEDFTTQFFNRTAEEVRANLVATKKLEKGETVRYVTLAFLNDAHATAGSCSPFKSREVPPDFQLLESDLKHFVDRSEAVGEIAPEDIPILIPQRVLDETRELALQSKEKETGGILIGHLHRDRNVPEVFVEVTAQIPAAHTVAEAAKLTFTADTWAAAQAAVDLRGEGETWVAWWHDHLPVGLQCKDCPEEKRAVCPLANGFFSQDDRQLHRTLFSKSFNTALTISSVTGGATDEVKHTLYGWRRGLIEPRGFYLLNNDLHPTGGERHAAK